MVRIGLVGVGYWGPNLARVIADVRGGELAALCDSDATRLDRMARRYPSARSMRSFDELIESPDVDAVVIATPADTHFELALRALSAGKHVLVEKPLARSSKDCLTLMEAASEGGLVLMPGHVFLYNAAVRKVRAYIESGELGDIYYAYSQRLNLGQVRRDVNAMWNLAPHDLSILGWWFGGPAERVAARGYAYVQPGIEDVAFMTLDYPGGIGANVHLSWLDPLKVRLMTVVGSEKMVVYDDTSADARIRLYDKGITRTLIEQRPTDATLGQFETFAQFQLLLRAGDVLVPRIDFVEPLQLEMEDFIAAVRGERVPVSTAQSGLDVVRTLEAAQLSLESAGASLPV